VIDTATNTVVGMPIAVPTFPQAIAITPDGTRAYVADVGSGNVAVIDTATNTVVGSPIPMGDDTPDVAITPDGSRAYAPHGTVTVIDIATNTVTGTPITLGATAFGLAITPDGARAYAAASPDSVRVIDTQSNTAIGTPITVGTDPRVVAIVPNQPPEASLTTKAKGFEATLDGAAASDPDGQVATYSWDFGDGQSAQTTSPTVEHTYEKVGEFTAKLTVTDNEGCSTGLVFTGTTASCNGSGVASASRLLGTVRLGKLKRNKERGTATLTVEVPGPGTLGLSGKGVAEQERPTGRASSAAKGAGGTGKVRLKIKAKGKRKRKLNRAGEVKLVPEVSFTPAGGDANAQTRKVKLIKRS
jgi:YVTN family beta-propeller protein